jgi:poly-gamma-glutamate capsule biosynthesis protein CapA/YwtB (metallophosphatase superfamily)
MWRNSLEEEHILVDIEEMKKLDCDVKILSLHRGAEYRIHPNQRQRNLARTLIDHGADLIIGGHSHVPGEIERYQGKYIFYSLGNFIFDQGRGKKATGSEFDYIYDHILERKTVPTYIAMLA